MKRIVFNLALMMVISFTSFAENNENKTEVKTDAKIEAEASILDVTGLITDSKTGESLAGVEVCLKGTELKTYTDFDGKFTFKNVKKGDYELVSSYISYQQGVTNVRADQTKNQLEIKLQSSN